MTTLTIKTATVAEAEPTIATVVLAFSADPPARWAYPEPSPYLLHYPNFVRAFGGQAFAHQSAYYLEGYAGAALWFPRGSPGRRGGDGPGATDRGRAGATGHFGGTRTDEPLPPE